MALATRVNADVDLHLSPRAARVVALDAARSSYYPVDDQPAEEVTQIILDRAEKFLEFLTPGDEAAAY